MTETFLNKLGTGKFIAESAGFELGILNQDVVKVMQELGIDISGNKTKSVFDLFKQNKVYDFVITVCDESNAERCPIFPGKTQRLHWSFTDPSSFKSEPDDVKLPKIRAIRDQIKARIEQFIKETN